MKKLFLLTLLVSSTAHCGYYLKPGTYRIERKWEPKSMTELAFVYAAVYTFFGLLLITINEYEIWREGLGGNQNNEGDTLDNQHEQHIVTEHDYTTSTHNDVVSTELE